MVAKCANPACGASFHYLRGGRLFFLDQRGARPALRPAAAPHKNPAVEFFWLCEQCSPQMTVIVDQNGQAGVVENRVAEDGPALPPRANARPMP